MSPRAKAPAKSTAKIAAKPTAKTAAKPTAKTAAKPTAKTAAKPAAKAAAKPAAKAAAKPTAKTAAKPTAKAAAKPTAKAAAKPTAKTAAKPVAKPTTKAAAKPASAEVAGPAGALEAVEAEASAVPRRRPPTTGTVALVAAGPGDPDLLTLRAASLLAGADLVVTDVEVEGIARTHAAPGAEIAVAVDGNGLPLPDADRARLAIEGAKQGRSVVRLFAGDPVIDGSFLSEGTVIGKARIEFEVAPGVSPATAVPAYAGYTLTGRRSREIHVVAPGERRASWSAIAEDRVTAVFLDAADSAPAIAASLIEAGRAPGSPVAITRGGTTVEQRTVVSTLQDVSVDAKAAKQAGPGVVVVGEVIDQRDRLSWFETKPLFGWRVLLPRTQERSDDLVERLVRMGAVPVEVPTISVEPPRTPQQMERAVHGLVSGRYEWIGFTSVNAVRAVREKLEQYGLDARSFAGLKVAAVGDDTAAALIAFGVQPDLTASGATTTRALLDEWPPYDELIDPINRVFLPRADIATEALASGLAELGWEVEDVTAYRTVRAAPPPAETREAIKGGGFDAVLFTSSSTVRNLVGIAGKPHTSTIVACIGPATAATAEEHGLRVDVLAPEPTHVDLAEALGAHGEALRRAAEEAGEASWRPSRRRPGARRKTT